LPSLDGLRAVSIILVLLGHAGGTRGFPKVNLQIGDYAHLGVVVFFVISGFLITTLLMHEFDTTRRISLQLFYARRSLRIFPASYFYLCVICLLSASNILHLTRTDFWHALTYTVNFLPGRSWQIGHLWSLSVEEQFYLLWPFAFAASGPRKANWVAWAVIVLAILARTVNRVFLIGTPYHDLEMFPMVADSLASGCLLAKLRGWLEGQAWYIRLFDPSWSLVVLALVLVLNRLSGYTIVSVLGASIINFGLAFLIHRSVYLAGSPVGRLLNWKPLAFVGVLSYSLYLWQQLFLDRASSAWMNAFPQNLAFAITAALASYFLLEKPLLGLRHRLRIRSEQPENSVSAS
jgi:peptidoglycan/LPS O-acetylase OafA/YrhL